MAAGALVLIKRITHWGDPTEEYSNKYYYLGSDPSSSAAWSTFADQVIAEEKKLYPAAVKVVRAYGYDSDSEDATAIWSKDFTVSPNTPVDGTFAGGGLGVMPSDCAAWIRWGTERFNSKGKRIYLRKYFHPAYGQSVGNEDTVLAGWRTAAATYAGYWYDGTHFGNRTISAAGHDDAIVGHAVSSYITTRTLKRRGKRK